MFFYCFAVLAALASIHAFECPSTGTFYHADVSTGCRVYHFCDNSVLQTLECSDGHIFDGHSATCVAASTADCFEHHRHKRSTSEGALMVHTIAIDELKQGARILYETVKDSALDTLKEVAPSVYGQIVEGYNVTIQTIKADVMLVLRKQVLPNAIKAYHYAKQMGGKVFGKLQRSYQMTNSTHINIESFHDIVEELTKDAKPYMNFGRYLAGRLLPQLPRSNGRAKRSVMDEITKFMDPSIKSFMSSIGGLMTGTGESVTAKIIIPTLTEMMSDPETRFELKKIFWSSKAAFAPVMDAMLRQQDYNTPQGTLIRVPSSIYEAAKQKFFQETTPMLMRVLSKHGASIFRRCTENLALIFKTVVQLKQHNRAEIAVLTDSVFRFFQKHGTNLFSASTGSHVTSYTLTEIKKDLKPIEMTLLQILINYLTRTPGSALATVFDRQSPFYRSFVGEETYARPAGNFYQSQRDLNAKYQNARSG